MSFIAKNPISAAEITSLPPVPIKGTRGIFAKEDGWYDIDDEGNVKKLGSDGSGGGSIAIDTEFDINSDNAIANKTVTEFVNKTKAPKEIIEFANNPLGEMKFVSDKDGLKIVWDCVLGKTEFLIASWESDVVFANHADFAYSADADDLGRTISSTYATKEELEDIPPVIADFGDIDIVEEQLIENNTIVHYGIISDSIVVSLSETPCLGFSSALYFTTPEAIPENYSQFPADVYFKGDSTDEGAFVPEANMRYTIVFDFDGYMLNGYVSGVSAPPVSEVTDNE